MAWGEFSSRCEQELGFPIQDAYHLTRRTDKRSWEQTSHSVAAQVARHLKPGNFSLWAQPIKSSSETDLIVCFRKYSEDEKKQYLEEQKREREKAIKRERERTIEYRRIIPRVPIPGFTPLFEFFQTCYAAGGRRSRREKAIGIEQEEVSSLAGRHFTVKSQSGLGVYHLRPEDVRSLTRARQNSRRLLLETIHRAETSKKEFGEFSKEMKTMVARTKTTSPRRWFYLKDMVPEMERTFRCMRLWTRSRRRLVRRVFSLMKPTHSKKRKREEGDTTEGNKRI
jgi:hypothetical protein